MNTKTKKIYLFHLTDFHYTFVTEHQLQWEKLFRLLIIKIKEIIKEKKIPKDRILFILTGDFYDRNKYIPSNKDDLMVKFIEELSTITHNINITTTIGNHEVKYKNESENNEEIDDSRTEDFKKYLNKFREIHSNIFVDSFKNTMCNEDCICKKLLNGSYIKNDGITAIKTKVIEEFTKDLYYEEITTLQKFKNVKCEWELTYNFDDFTKKIIGVARDELYIIIEDKICSIQTSTDIKALFDEDLTYGKYKKFYTESLSRPNSKDYFIGNIKEKWLENAKAAILHLNSSLFSLSGDQYNNFTATGVIRAKYFEELILNFKNNSADYKFVVSHYPIENWSELHDDFKFHKDELKKHTILYKYSRKDRGGFKSLKHNPDIRFINLMFFGHTHESNIAKSTKVYENQNDDISSSIVITGCLNIMKPNGKTVIDLDNITETELAYLKKRVSFTFIEIDKIDDDYIYNRIQYSPKTVNNKVCFSQITP